MFLSRKGAGFTPRFFLALIIVEIVALKILIRKNGGGPVSDPPKIERVTIFWVVEKYHWVINPNKQEKKEVDVARYGPFSNKEKAEEAGNNLIGIAKELEARLRRTKFFRLYNPKFNLSSYFVKQEEVPQVCIERQFPDDPDDGQFILHAMYGEKEVRWLFDPDYECLAWQKLASFGFLIEGFL